LGLLKKNEKKLARSFKFTFHYIDGVLSLHNSRFFDCVDKEILIGTTNSEINYKRYTPYTGAAGKLLSINESSQLEN
jgi:hypothetical protein